MSALPEQTQPALSHTSERERFSTATRNARHSLRSSICLVEDLRHLTRTRSQSPPRTPVQQIVHSNATPQSRPTSSSTSTTATPRRSRYLSTSAPPNTCASPFRPNTPATSSPLSPWSHRTVEGMSHKLKKGTRGLFSRLFVKPYEPVQTHGSVHNLARVGGVSVLCLPMEFAACDLVIPTRFAACGQFLIDFGIHVPGLFRIPGQTRTVTALKDHFLGHLYLDAFTTPHQQDIEVTVRLAALPSQSVVAYNIHDVASTFKFFLGELDGGILGSVDVFESLRKVLLPKTTTAGGKEKEKTSLEWACRGIDEQEKQEDDGIEARWVARVLCGIECAQRRNLILAVFGILAMLKQDPIDSVMASPSRSAFPTTFSDSLRELSEDFQPAIGNERMSSKALSLVFAPLLLGNLTDQIHIEEKKHHHTLSSPALFRRRSIPRTASAFHFKRFSNNSSQSSPQNSPSKRNHISAPIQASAKESSPFVERLKRVGAKTGQGVELGLGVERNKTAAKMIELCVRNWEDVVECLRDGGGMGGGGGDGRGC
ncbi:hypothetical protein FKW77_004934 [Venturia effusa]|uniref:Rho-GAP domain-containing protein n=1 Tax=Venturia effusa TaxID=50376 RepID=A0A517LK56_9PEZI|nr:hypothetical protein FKW77_004934 [Venturia effusa]